MAEGHIDRRRFLAGGLSGAAALGVGGLLAACGSSSGGGGGGTSSVASNGSIGIGSGTPKRGGTLTFGTTADIDGFLPSTNHWDNNGYLCAEAVLEPLTVITADGGWKPNLASAVTPNADYTQWTIAVRPNVTFHDGSPLNADVVVANLQQVLASPLTGQALPTVSGVKATDPMTVQIDLNAPTTSIPWGLSAQVGFIVALKQLEAKDTQHPIGTGPFKLVEWVPNSHFTVAANRSYWRNGLPYLDGITYKPIVADASRESTLRSGGIDIMVTRDPQAIVDLQHDSSYQQINALHDAVGEPDVDFIILNTAVAPLNDLRVRQALAHGIDTATLSRLFGDGITAPITGPFQPGSPYYAPGNGYPTYDKAKAAALIEAAKADHGGAIAFNLDTIPDPKLSETIQAIQNMWQAIGCNVTIGQVQQAELITNMALGNFQAYTSEQFGAPNPDMNSVWWESSTAKPVGQIALNFARNKDPIIDQALVTGRSTTDPATKAAAYQTIDKQLAQDLPYLWLRRAPWSCTATTKVQNFAGSTAPDGTRIQALQSGVIQVQGIWLA